MNDWRTAQELIFDWNEVKRRAPVIHKRPEFEDETLRDGIQSPSVVDPTIEDKLTIVHFQAKVGVTTSTIGIPASSPKAFDDCLRIAQEIARERLSVIPNCVCRTVQSDIEPIAEIAQRAGIPIGVCAFIGSSPIRQYAENWDVDYLVRTSEAAIRFAVAQGLEVAFVTEDTTRSHPADLDRLFRHAIGLGVRRLILCDTVGHATPDGTFNLIRWTRNLIESTGENVKIDWHGHNDRGLAVPVAIHALEAGADRVHGTILGIGERVGNAALDQILVNLKLMGAIDNDLCSLLEYCETVSRACHWPIPRNYPLAGSDAFRTATGVHAAAIIKAFHRNEFWLADRVYSSVPAGVFGKVQEIEVGHMSGKSNVKAWLSRHGYEYEERLAQAILKRAKASDRTLEAPEIEAVIREHRSS